MRRWKYILTSILLVEIGAPNAGSCLAQCLICLHPDGHIIDALDDRIALSLRDHHKRLVLT